MGLLEQIYEKAKENPQRIAFPEAVNEKMMQAAYETGKEGYIIPVLVGNADEIREALSARGYEEDIFTIVDIREEIYKKKLIDRVCGPAPYPVKRKGIKPPHAESAVLCHGHGSSGRGGRDLCGD